MLDINDIAPIEEQKALHEQYAKTDDVNTDETLENDATLHNFDEMQENDFSSSFLKHLLKYAKIFICAAAIVFLGVSYCNKSDAKSKYYNFNTQDKLSIGCSCAFLVTLVAVIYDGIMSYKEEPYGSPNKTKTINNFHVEKQKNHVPKEDDITSTAIKKLAKYVLIFVGGFLLQLPFKAVTPT